MHTNTSHHFQLIQLLGFGYCSVRLSEVCSVNGRHQPVWLWVVLDGWPAAAIPGRVMWLTPLHPSLGNGPAGCGGADPSHTALLGMSFKENSPLAARHGFPSALTDSLKGAFSLKGFWELCRSLLAGFHWPTFTSLNIQANRCVTLHEKHVGTLPRLESSLVSKWPVMLEVQTANHLSIWVHKAGPETGFSLRYRWVCSLLGKEDLNPHVRMLSVRITISTQTWKSWLI